MTGQEDWITRCLSGAETKAAEEGRAVPSAVVETYRGLLADRLQRPLKPDELRQVVIELATANSATDAARED